jgi:glycosyltransferase involved in cell wall biosynthesis
MHSILITSYECGGRGSEFLKKNLESVFSQTYRPLQCVVSDHSRDDVIETMVKTLDSNGVEFVYVRYTENRGNPCHNWNNALNYATGDTLQYTCLDDRFIHPNALEDALSFMKTTGAQWIACAALNDPGKEFFPKWNSNILTTNTVGPPGAVIFRKTLKFIQFDPTFNWLLDTDWYFRLYERAGPPTIFDKVTYINCIGDHQLTNTVNTQPRRDIEYALLHRKYGMILPTTPS